ncbi:MAG: ParB N-terminal domain-containing protein [Desulfovibrio sp.]|jgi:hypothetical protein|nr:ParB N-terminal domain-containing protein [Desulfovibrio sp.]
MPGENSVQVSEDIKVIQLPVSVIKPNDWNPNELSDQMFSRLVDDMQKIGFLQPILVTPTEDGEYRIVDGEHRYQCAKLIDMEFIPCVVVDGDFAHDEEAQKIQTMRMNMIRGNVDKRKLQALVTDLVENRPLEEVSELMAYDDVDGLRALIEDARKDLPPELRKEFDKVKEEIKTTEDLSLVLNRLFTKYGSTVPYNYMILDFGGKEHMWVRLKDRAMYKKVKKVAEICKGKKVTFSSALMSVLGGLTPNYIDKHIKELEGVTDEAAEIDFSTENVEKEIFD